VLAAVELDDEFGFSAAEVCDERTNRMLSSELELRQPPVTQAPPQFPLCIRL
jgi:hypothetical protein